MGEEMKYTLILMLILTSCESQRAARKLSWLKEKGYISTDTVMMHDTLVGFSVDTLVRFDTLSHTDTITIEKNGVKVVTVTRWQDRVIEQVITQRDTILSKPVEITRIKKCVHTWWHNFWQHFLIGVGFVLLILLTFVWVLKTLE